MPFSRNTRVDSTRAGALSDQLRSLERENRPSGRHHDAGQLTSMNPHPQAKSPVLHEALSRAQSITGGTLRSATQRGALHPSPHMSSLPAGPAAPSVPGHLRSQNLPLNRRQPQEPLPTVTRPPSLQHARPEQPLAARTPTDHSRIKSVAQTQLLPTRDALAREAMLAPAASPNLRRSSGGISPTPHSPGASSYAQTYISPQTHSLAMPSTSCSLPNSPAGHHATTVPASMGTPIATDSPVATTRASRAAHSNSALQFRSGSCDTLRRAPSSRASPSPERPIRTPARPDAVRRSGSVTPLEQLSKRRVSCEVAEGPRAAVPKALSALLARGRGIAGLGNMGNTCYMNSMLQCLACVPGVLENALTGNMVTCGGGGGVAQQFAELLCEMSGRQMRDVLRPAAFIGRLARVDGKWGVGRQQDAQEFLVTLLSLLQQDCNTNAAPPTYRELSSTGTVEQQAAEALRLAEEYSRSWVDAVFGGMQQSTVTCATCGHESHCFDRCHELSVPIPVTSTEKCSLLDCLLAYVKPERLDACYACRGCKGSTCKTRKLQMYSLPATLIIILKRFATSALHGGDWEAVGGGRGRRARKNCAHVFVPAVLDMHQFSSEVGRANCKFGRSRYELIAMAQHVGSLSAGHYTAAGRAVSTGAWYRFNDDLVSPCACPEGYSDQAYVLFYQAVS